MEIDGDAFQTLFPLVYLASVSLLPLVALFLFRKLSVLNFVLTVIGAVVVGGLVAYAIAILAYGGAFSKPGVQIGRVYYVWGNFGWIAGAVAGTFLSLFFICLSERRRSGI